MTAVPKIRKIIRNAVISPIQEFIRDSRAVGVTLLACTIASIALANSGYAADYLDLFEIPTPAINGLHLPHNILHWINDGAMALFFFLVGMEIKRELLIGELSSLKKSTLPIVGALGGMLVPALIYFMINRNTPYQNGWGIPMATDIAFSLGVASLLGKRVPVSLKIFLMALAIIDDLGAILVIALFYGGELQWNYLLYAALLVGLILVLNKLKWHRLLVTVIGGLALWYFIYNSGIHSTIAGVIIALLVPLDRLNSYENKLNDIVHFIILPIFALANTAIVFPENLVQSLSNSLAWGVLLGLVLGKPLGIFLFCWLTLKLDLGEKPADINLLQLSGMGVLAGIGFTMSIFITMLAFADADHQNISKMAVLIGSAISSLAGILVLFAGHKRNNRL